MFNPITLHKAQSLGLDIQETENAVVWVGSKVALMKVLGETCTTFCRQDITLEFSALVVADMPVDILGGFKFS